MEMDQNLPALGPALPPKSPRMVTNLPTRNHQHRKEDKHHHTTHDRHHPAHHHPDDMQHDRSHRQIGDIVPQHHNGKDQGDGVRYSEVGRHSGDGVDVDVNKVGEKVGYPPYIGDTRLSRGIPKGNQSHDQLDRHRHQQVQGDQKELREGVKPLMPVITASHPNPDHHPLHSMNLPVDLNNSSHTHSPNYPSMADHQHSKPTSLHIHPPALGEDGKGPPSAPPLQARHINTPPESTSSNQQDQSQKQKDGKGKEGGGGGGMLDRLRTSLLTGGRGPMSKTWARKSYVEELESIGPSSPTRTTGFRSLPVSPHTQNHERGSGLDMESQSQPRELDLPRARSVYASPAALAQFRALPPMNAQGEIMSPPNEDAGVRRIGRV